LFVQQLLQLDRAQDEVELARGNPQANSSRLFEAKETRDMLTNKLELILNARETIMDLMDEVEQSNTKTKKTIRILVLQEYVQLRDKVQRLKEERHTLTQQKVNALLIIPQYSAKDLLK